MINGIKYWFNNNVPITTEHKILTHYIIRASYFINFTCQNKNQFNCQRDTPSDQN